MIVISDLSESYIQEIAIPEMAKLIGGKRGRGNALLNLNLNIAIVPIIQLNVLTNGSSNFANPIVRF
jgi:hypothetical protein